ncbi:hypothetical protein [Streptomyces sp. NPDC055709]
MKRAGPLITLITGLVVGLFMLSLNATTGKPAPSSYGRATPSPAASPTAPRPPSPAPSKPATPTANPRIPAVPSPSPSPVPDAKYAGRTADDTASVAITLRKGRAVAYFCDGHTREAWLRGAVEGDGSMHLTGRGGSKLDGAVSGGQVTGTVVVEDRSSPFTAAEAGGRAGVYRATAEVRGTKVVGGWIVLQNGRQVGIVNRGGKPAAAPPIDPATGRVEVDGTPLTAAPVVP